MSTDPEPISESVDEWEYAGMAEPAGRKRVLPAEDVCPNRPGRGHEWYSSAYGPFCRDCGYGFVYDDEDPAESVREAYRSSLGVSFVWPALTDGSESA